MASIERYLVPLVAPQRTAASSAGIVGHRAGYRVNQTLEQAGLTPSASATVGSAIRITLSGVFIFAAFHAARTRPASESLNEAGMFLPKLLAALALLLGIVLAGLARERVDRLT